MTVMTIKQIVDFTDKSGNEHFSDSDEFRGKVEEISIVLDSLMEDLATAKEIILKKITEKQFVRFMESVSKITTFSAAEQGRGSALMMAAISGQLQGYTHTVVLATIGALINEEVL